MNSIILINWS